MPGRVLPAQGVRGPGLHAPAGPGHEVLQRRGDPLQGAVHGHQHPSSLRQGGLPAHRGRARYRRRSDPARQSLHPGRRRHSRSRRTTSSSRTSSISIARWPQWFADRKPGPRVAQGPAPHRRRRSQRGAARARRLEPQAAPQDRLAHAGRGRAVRPPAGVARLDRRAAPLRARRTRSSIRGGAIATTTGAPPIAAGGSTISWPRRRCRAPSRAIASTSTCATGRRRRTTCRCWRRSRSRGEAS